MPNARSVRMKGKWRGMTTWWIVETKAQIKRKVHEKRKMRKDGPQEEDEKKKKEYKEVRDEIELSMRCRKEKDAAKKLSENFLKFSTGTGSYTTKQKRMLRGEKG